MTQNNLLPTFIIGGSPRSGTTFLCHALEKHPDVFIAKPFVPEPKICLKFNPLGIEGYKKDYEKLFSTAPHKKARGEKSSAYLENKEAVERLRLVFNETIRFLFIVREPVKRAYSNYLISKKNGFETLSFREAIELEGKRQDPFPPERSYVRPFDYLIRGNYGVFAKRYFDAFGPEQVKFALFEDIALAPDRFYQEIQTAIEVDPLPRSKLETNQINVNTNKGEDVLDPIFEAELRERMRPQVEYFAALTQLNVGAWGY